MQTVERKVRFSIPRFIQAFVLSVVCAIISWYMPDPIAEWLRYCLALPLTLIACSSIDEYIETLDDKDSKE